MCVTFVRVLWRLEEGTVFLGVTRVTGDCDCLMCLRETEARSLVRAGNAVTWSLSPASVVLEIDPHNVTSVLLRDPGLPGICGPPASASLYIYKEFLEYAGLVKCAFSLDVLANLAFERVSAVRPLTVRCGKMLMFSFQLMKVALCSKNNQCPLYELVTC